MEYGGGNSLEQYIKSKPKGYLDEKEARFIFKQILEAVDYLHQKNVTHRDIKTENILLNKHLNLKIIDFGFSLICNSLNIQAPMAPKLLLTPTVAHLLTWLLKLSPKRPTTLNFLIAGLSEFCSSIF